MLNHNISAVDFLTAFAILSSGNSVGKVALFAQFANIKFISMSTFHRLQKYIFILSIDTYWENHQSELAQSLLDQNLVMLGELNSIYKNFM